ncbi:MAG: cobalamin biosynthesis protein [Alphaproteobacteria bacterium]|nr:cobalamin biosynthesis protein [Alphaproteobacteria bacterium]
MIVAGFGFRRSAGLDSLRAALAATGHDGDIALVATAAGKEEGLRPLGLALGVPVRGIAASALAAQKTPSRSAASQAAYGTGSVAEAAALAAAGPGATLVGARAVSPDRKATCAIARKAAP